MISVLRMSLVWYQTHKELFELIALAVAFSGVVLAVRSISDGRKMTRDLRSVFDHLTTRGLGPFASYMAEVARLIGEARRGLVIACGSSSYRVLAGRGRHSAYPKLLERRK